MKHVPDPTICSRRSRIVRWSLIWRANAGSGPVEFVYKPGPMFAELPGDLSRNILFLFVYLAFGTHRALRIVQMKRRHPQAYRHRVEFNPFQLQENLK